MGSVRRILRLSALGIVACNGYHALNVAARLIGAHALRDATTLDPDELSALLAD